jgi:hypothetical protein
MDSTSVWAPESCAVKRVRFSAYDAVGRFVNRDFAKGNGGRSIYAIDGNNGNFWN